MNAIVPVALPKTDNAIGILCLCVGLTVFSIQDLILKLLSVHYPLGQAMVFRSLVAVPLLLWMALREGGVGNLFTAGTLSMIQRGAILVAAYFAYYLAIPSLPLAKVAALYFTLPFFLTILCGLTARRSVGWRRWGAVAFGFAGVPFVIAGDWATAVWILPLLSALSYASLMLFSRRVGQTQTASAMAFWANAVFLVFAVGLSALFGWGWAEGTVTQPSLRFLLQAWIWPSTVDALLMAGCGGIAALGLTLLSQSYKLSDSARVAPFEYTALIWAIFWGFMFFDEWPRPIEWVGMAMILVAGLAVLKREKARDLPLSFQRVAADPPV